MTLTLNSNATASTLLASSASGSTSASTLRLPARLDLNLTSAAPAASTSGAGSAATAADAATNALDRAATISDAAAGAGAAISNSLVRIRQTVVAATDEAATPAERAALSAKYQSLVSGVASAVKAGGFDGVNLLDGSTEPGGVSFQTGSDGAGTVTLHGADLNPHGATVDLAPSVDLTTPTSAKSALDRIDTSIVATQGALARIDTQSKSISAHADALASLSSAGGAADTTDADAAGLIALQVRQQLGAQSASLVNRAPQSILSLFKS